MCILSRILIIIQLSLVPWNIRDFIPKNKATKNQFLCLENDVSISPKDVLKKGKIAKQLQYIIFITLLLKNFLCCFFFSCYFICCSVRHFKRKERKQKNYGMRHFWLFIFKAPFQLLFFSLLDGNKIHQKKKKLKHTTRMKYENTPKKT